ncbi:MAG: hypothetical protein K8I27_13345, partial [Planctomycetes bacterium]|nr:hypothetical protein [Planctomycetota bacterium]
MLRNFILVAALAAVASVTAFAQTMMPLPPQSSIYTSSQVRGYYFQAPTSFTITGLRVPASAGTGAQYIQVMRLPAAPPFYSASTSTHTTLAFIQNLPGTTIAAVNIQVNAGDHIGILGARVSGTNMANSYATGPHATNINGQPVTLYRFLYQTTLLGGPAGPVSQSASGQIANVEMYYTVGLTITTPNPLPDGVDNLPYSQPIQADFGVPSYSWTVGTGLPPGIVATTLGNDLILSGTPTTVGSYSFMVTVTDHDTPPVVKQKLFTIDIKAPNLEALESDEPPTVTPVRFYSGDAATSAPWRNFGQVNTGTNK